MPWLCLLLGWESCSKRPCQHGLTGHGDKLQNACAVRPCRNTFIVSERWVESIRASLPWACLLSGRKSAVSIIDGGKARFSICESFAVKTKSLGIVGTAYNLPRCEISLHTDIRVVGIIMNELQTPIKKPTRKPGTPRKPQSIINQNRQIFPRSLPRSLAAASQLHTLQSAQS